MASMATDRVSPHHQRARVADEGREHLEERPVRAAVQAAPERPGPPPGRRPGGENNQEQDTQARGDRAEGGAHSSRPRRACVAW